MLWTQCFPYQSQQYGPRFVKSLERWPSCWVTWDARRNRWPNMDACMKSGIVPSSRQCLLQDTSSDVPLLIHSFSNGGAFLLEEMEQQLQQGRLQKTNSAYKYEFLASRMKNGCQLFDSCPCYIRPIWDTKYYSSSFPHPQWYKCSRLVYTAVASLSLTLWCTCTLSWHRPDQFWKRMLQSNVCLHQIFIYTTTDLLSDAASMDRFINNRRAQNVECTVYRYDDSDHCRLNRDHPEAYGRAIDTALSDSIRRSTGK
jgi:Eukaryotic protein of unknown function (DUF829)